MNAPNEYRVVGVMTQTLDTHKLTRGPFYLLRWTNFNPNKDR